MELPEVRPRRLAVAAVALSLWTLALWTFWISQPLEDQVTVVKQEQVELDLAGDGVPVVVVPVTVTADCGSPWSARSGPDVSLPVLGEGERYDHDPCVRVRRDNRIVLGMNLLVVVLGFGAIGLMATRRSGKNPSGGGGLEHDDGSEPDRMTADSTT